MTTDETQVQPVRSYHPEDYKTDESALRAMLHIVAGVALQISNGQALSAGMRADLENIVRDDALWPETRRIIAQLKWK